MRFCAYTLAITILLSPACNGDPAPATDTTDIAADSAQPDTAVDAVEPPEGCLSYGTDGATASCLTPTQTAEYYEDQAERYFDTLDVDADRDRVPDYSELVARWEWPPWLLLTAYGRADMIQTADSLRIVDPSTVPERDCRFFETQPFARCYVEFEYEGGPCPIYEEFVFNDQGEMTFIEAWSNLPDLLPNASDDPWGEAADFPRLSTRVPGLGNAEGRIDLESEWMQQAAEDDSDVADFALRATDWGAYWIQALAEAPDDFFSIGCGW